MNYELGWINWFWQFICDRLSSFNPKGFYYLAVPHLVSYFFFLLLIIFFVFMYVFFILFHLTWFIPNHSIFPRFPWCLSQILLKLDWNDPFCNRNEPWKFQLSIRSGFEFMSLNFVQFFHFGWSWADNYSEIWVTIIYWLELYSA